MPDKRIQGDAFVNSIVGEGTHFKGDLELNGLLRLDGDFTGSIKTEGKVIIGKNGRADCAIDASIVVIGGVFRGNIYARERVILLSSSMVIGNIYSPRIIAEEGVILNGTFVVSGKINNQKSHKVESSEMRKKRGNFLQFIKGVPVQSEAKDNNHHKFDTAESFKEEATGE
jgi:cytoskeletal protein CcmA (bactofilin family)